MKSLILSLTLILTAAASLFAQDVDAIAARIDLQRTEFPQEKIHVMTDQGSYLAGDTIWLRAWVVDAATHQPVNASQFVYVELVSPIDSVNARIKIHPDANGVFRGYIPLDIDLPEGRYQLTAYTMFMQSVGVDYFYSQPIEMSQVVSGRVLSEWRKNPVAGGKVSLIAPRVGYSSVTFTDSLGEFAINMPLLPDSVDCVVMAENIKGKKQMNLELDDEQFPTTYYTTLDKVTTAVPTFGDDQLWRLERSGDWRHIILNEVMVTGYRPRRHSNERNPYNLTNRKIKEKEITTLDGVAREIPNLMVMNGSLYTPGGRAKDHVTIYVDGEPIAANFETDESASRLLSEYISPIEPKPQSNIFLGYQGTPDLSELSVAQSMISFQDVAYIYFVRDTHGGGSLFIEHREGYLGDRKEPSMYLKITQPMGVQTPAEFYSPRYDQDDGGHEPGSDLRKLLYWNPCVTLNQDGTSSFDFYASDAHNTTYIVTIEGIGNDGTLFRTTHYVAKR